MDIRTGLLKKTTITNWVRFNYYNKYISISRPSILFLEMLIKVKINFGLVSLYKLYSKPGFRE